MLRKKIGFNGENIARTHLKQQVKSLSVDISLVEEDNIEFLPPALSDTPVAQHEEDLDAECERLDQEIENDLNTQEYLTLKEDEEIAEYRAEIEAAEFEMQMDQIERANEALKMELQDLQLEELEEELSEEEYEVESVVEEAVSQDDDANFEFDLRKNRRHGDSYKHREKLNEAASEDKNSRAPKNGPFQKEGQKKNHYGMFCSRQADREAHVTEASVQPKMR